MEPPDRPVPEPAAPAGGMRNVTALGIVSFFTDVSTEMVLGVLPFFIVSTLGASRLLLGTIEGSAELVSYAFRMLSGSWSDKTGRRKVFVLAGYAASTASKPFFAAASSWVDAFLVRSGDRVGKGIRTAPRDALIADSVPESRVGRAFGLHRTIDQLGAIVGPVAAFALLQVVDIRGVFLASLIPGAIAVLVLVFFVKEIAVKSKAGTTMLGNIRVLLKGNRPLLLLLGVAGIFSLGAFNFSFVLLRASDLGVEESFIPLVYAAINVSHAVIGIPSGILADRIGKEKTLIIGYSVFLVSTLLMVMFAGNVLYAYVLAAVFGLYVGISETVQRAVIPRYVPSELRGTAFGLYNLIIGVCFFASNVMFGFLWDSFGLAAAVSYSAAVTMVAISAMGVFLRKYKTQQPI
ncbi:MFS transporter [Nitrososphaera sp.]|uniref:MFS transporter n=1 Tax=Nitrososphaera sp. TaxID=1971748 RepID=UPI0017D28221|nr:MFS transporter [Nitrososphaera sp.]NWG36668.1 MFS transporter [Nitrososphaera sp.]